MSATMLGANRDRTLEAAYDWGEVERAIRLLFPRGETVELRIPHSRKGTVSGYYTKPSPLFRDCLRWSGAAPGVYVTPNPVDPTLVARAHNHAAIYARSTTGDADIICRRWLLVDFDPVRPSGISATDLERDLAIQRAAECRDWLRELGWPDVALADSGNGGHLLAKIDLANDDASRELVEGCLKALAFRFNDELVEVDERTFNAARIWKLYGTKSCKGDDTPDRPHRLSRLLHVPEPLEIVPPELLADLARRLPEAEAVDGPSEPGLTLGDSDLERWIEAYGVPVFAKIPRRRGGWVYRLNPCPWNPAHDDQAAYISWHADGRITAGCFHNGCKDLGWRELRDLYEPGWRERIRPKHPATDLGNARRFAEAFREDLRYCALWDRWLVREAGRWTPDVSGQVERCAKELVLSLRQEPGAGRWAKKAQALERIQALLQLARTEPEFLLRPDEVAPEVWRVVVGDGVLDVRTGELLPPGVAPNQDADPLDLGTLEEDFRTALLRDARAAGFPPLRAIDVYLDGEASWSAFCLEPRTSNVRLASVSAALREAVSC